MAINLIKKILKIILLIVFSTLILVTIVGGMLGFSMAVIMEKAPKIEPKTILLNMNENSKIVDKDGKLIESIAYDEYREIVKYDDIPKQLIDAFISIEDERFIKHNGIDFIGIGKSIIDNIVAGDIVRGGSTITQQLVKNVYLTEDVKWERKITELYLAMKVDNELSKEEIMESYLNRVYLGQHSYGIKVGAKTYFSKELKDLSLAQCATLAGIVNSPATYSLFYSYPPTAVPEGGKVLGEYSVGGENFKAVLNEDAFTRKNLVLKKMLQLGKISQEEYDSAMSEDVAASVKPGTKKPKEYSSYISDLIKKQAVAKIQESQNLSEDDARNILYTGGLTIKTTVDWDMQKRLEEIYDDFTNVLSGFNKGAPFLASVSKDDNGDILDVYGNKLFYRRGNLLTENNEYYVPEGYYTVKDNGDLNLNTSRFYLNGEYLYVVDFYDINDDENIVTYRSGSISIPVDHSKKEENGSITLKKAFLDKIKDFYRIEDGKLIINNNYYMVETQGTIQPQSSTVILDSKTGEIKALIGGRGHSKDDTINRAISFQRQPGSSMKPLAVYAPALDSGYTLASPIDDTPFEMLDGRAWPSNAYGTYDGILTLRRALAISSNTTAVKLLNKIGIETSKNYLERFGIINAKQPDKDNYISSKEDAKSNDENLAFSLGAATRGFTVIDMAQAYLTFPGEGSRKDAMIISEINSSKLGKLYENDHKKIPVVSPETAFLTTQALKDVLKYGPYSGATNDYGIETAGKTGTTENNADVWFAGYNPYYTSVSWIGFDNNNIKLDNGSALAATFYGRYMNEFLKGKDEAYFNKPDGIVTEVVSKEDGLLPNQYTASDPRGSMVIEEYFDKKTVPTEVSTAHVSVKVDTRNGLLATSKTPPFLTANKVFVNRPIDYNPSEFNNIVPEDWKYLPPTKESDLKFEPIQTTDTLADGTTIVKKQLWTGEIITTTSYPDGRVVVVTKKVDGTETTQVIPSPSENPLPPSPPAPPEPADPPEQQAPEDTSDGGQ